MANDYEYVYNGLTFGGAQNIGVLSVEGLDPPDYRENTEFKPSDHGAYVFAQYIDPRRVIFELDVVNADASTALATLQTLRAAFIPQASDLPLTFKWPGLSQMRVFCVPVRNTFALSTALNIGMANPHVEFLAGDPFIYSDTATNLTVSANSSGTMTNNGNYLGFIESAVITGPGTTFTLRRNSDNAVIKINTTLTAGQTITVNFKNHTIIKNDGTNLYGSLDSTSVWWSYPVGNVDLGFLVASGSTGATQVVATYRSVWL